MTDRPDQTDSSTVPSVTGGAAVEASTPGPGFAQAVGFVFLWEVAAFSCSGVLRVLFADTPDLGGIFTSNVCWLIGYVIAWLVVFLILIRSSRGAWRAHFPLHRVSARDIVFAVAVKLVIVCAVLAVAFFLPFYDRVRPAADPDATRPAALAIAVIGVIGPICEELFFRGWVLLGFLNRYSAAKAAMLSALLFAVMHINPVLMVMTFATGCFYAWMVRRTGSLIPTIVAHVVGNTIFVVAHIVMGR